MVTTKKIHGMNLAKPSPFHLHQLGKHLHQMEMVLHQNREMEADQQKTYRFGGDGRGKMEKGWRRNGDTKPFIYAACGDSGDTLVKINNNNKK